jgi:ribose transport system substrate-binding protein
MKPSLTPVALAALAAALVLSACSATSSSKDTDSAGGSTDAAKAALASAYEGEPGTVPTEPVTPKAGVTLWVVSCGEQIPSCTAPTAAAIEAGKAVGWKTKTCDGQLNPGGWGNCIRQAVSAKADVVIPVGIDCAAVQAPMSEAKEAGVLVVGGGGADCDVTGGAKIMASERLQLPGVSIEEYWKLNGKLQADWIIGRTDGKAKVFQVNFTDPIWGPWITEGFTAELATCEGCSIVSTLDIANNDFVSNSAAQKFSSGLLKASDANAVSIPVGGWMPAGFDQAIRSSGKSDLVVATGFGDASSMELIRTAPYPLGTVGYASPWGGYGSVDTAIRLLAGQEPVAEGDGFQMVDKTHNLPESGDYDPGVDYKAEYRKLWGVS